MDKLVTVIQIKNPFEPLAPGARVTTYAKPGSTVGEILSGIDPHLGNLARCAPADLSVAINGEVMVAVGYSEIAVPEGSSLVFCAVPKGGGGKNILGIIAMLAVLTVAWYVAPMIGEYALYALPYSIQGAYVGVQALAAASIIAAGGMLVNSVFPPVVPDAGGYDNFDQSSTYGWGVAQNQSLEGIPVPILYGAHRIVPPIIGRYVESTIADKNYLHMLYCIADHQVDSMTSIRVNEQAFTNYKEVVTFTRPGNPLTVAPPYGFGDTREDITVNQKLDTTDPPAWINVTTSGTAVQQIGVSVTLPKGLYYANDSGGLDSQSVQLLIETSPTGAGTWTRWKQYNKDELVIVTGRWSAGYDYNDYSSDGYGNSWIEVYTDGSTDPGAHEEGEKYQNSVWIDDGGEGYWSPKTYWHWLTTGSYREITDVLYDYARIDAAQTTPLRRTYYTGELTPGQYDIRVKFNTLPPSGTRYGNDVYFDSYTEIILDDFLYPGTATLSVYALANDQLAGQMPKVDLLAERSTVPVYTGSAYALKDADNPAWACYDILHRARYKGSGTVTDPANYQVEGVAASKIDYTSFNDWATFCADTAGGKNAYTCNIYFDGMMNVRKALDTVSVLGRGVVVQMGSKFKAIYDGPTSLPVQKFLFNMGNIVKDSFQIDYIPLEDRANSVEITYFDASLDYARTSVEVFADGFDASTDEINRTQLTLYGCTDRTMAIRHGKFLMKCNRYITQAVSFDADVDALACLPGEVIQVQHDVPQWGEGGRVVSATSNTITLDRTVTIEGGKSYGVMVKHQLDDTREEKTVTTGAGDYTTLTISGTWTATPAQYALYSFGEIGSIVKDFRVTKLTRSSDMRRNVKAVEFIPEVYSDTATVPAPSPPAGIKVPYNLTAREIWLGGVKSDVNLSWGNENRVWYVFMRIGGGAPALLGTTSANYFVVKNLDVGITYTWYVSSTAFPWDGVSVELAITGRDGAGTLPDPAFIVAQCYFYNQIQLVWETFDDPLLGYYEVRTDTNWGNPTNMVYQGKANMFIMVPETTSYTFYLKSHDTFRNYSANYDSIALSQTVPTPVFVGITDQFSSVRIEWQPIADERYDVVEIWRHTANDRGAGEPPANASLIGEVHGSVFVDSSTGIDVDYWYWIRARSSLGVYSSWESGQTSGHNGKGTWIDTADIADQAIDQTKLASTIIPPEVVTSLPTLPDAGYPIGKIVYLTTDGKLYRNKDNVWTAEVAGADVTGTIYAKAGGVEIVAALPTLPDSDYPVGCFVFLTSDEKLYRNASGTWTTAVDVDDLDRLILSADIATGTITTKNLFVGDWSNMIPNPTFEGGSGHYWNWQQAPPCGEIKYKTDSGVPSGCPTDYCFQLYGTFANANISANQTAQGQDSWIDLVGGETFTLSSYMASDNAGTGGNLGAYMYVVKQDESVVGQSFVGCGIAGPNQSWTYVSGQATMPTGAKKGMVVWQKDAGTGSPNFYFTQSRLRKAAESYLIVDGAITSDKIFANAVTAGKIDAGAVGADEIAAGTISTEHLIVGNFENLIPNGNSEMGTAAVGLDPEGINLVNEAGYAGNWCRKWVASAAGYFFWSPTGYGDNRMKAQEGERYYHDAYIKCTSGGATVHLSTWFYDGNFSNVGGNSNVLESTGSWVKYSCEAAAPAGTQYVVFGLYAEDAGTYYVDNIFAKRMVQGNLIVDGAIQADHLDANSVTAGKIAAGAIGADEIAANTILAKHLTVADFSNVIYNPDLENATDYSGWNNGDWSGTGTSIVSDSGAQPKQYAFKMDSDGRSWSGINNNNKVTADPAEVFFFSCYVKKTGSPNNVFLLILQAYTNADAVIGNYGISLSQATVTTAWVRYTAKVAMPANTAYAIPILWNAGTAGQYFAFKPHIRRAANAELIVDGSITADKIAANTITAGKMNVTTLSSIVANIGTITAGKCQNAGGTNFIDFNATGTSSFLKVGSNVNIKADGTGTFKRIIVTNPWVESYGTKTGVGFQEAEKTIYIDTTINELTDPWYTTENSTRIARLSPGSGTRSGSHNLVLWKLEPSYFEARGYEVSGPSYVTWQGTNWYWGDVGIKVVGLCMNYIVGDSMTNLAWSNMRV